MTYLNSRLWVHFTTILKLGSFVMKKEGARMRFISVIILTVVTILALGCSGTKEHKAVIVENQQGSGQGTQNGVVPNKNIGLVMKTLTNPFFIEMEKGARQAVGGTQASLTVKTGAQETAITQQIAIIEELISDKVDAIVISPASSTELIPVLKKAQDANIPIINIDNQLDKELCRKVGLLNVPFISVNNEQGGYLSAQYISEKITVPTEVVILEGMTSAQNSQERRDGALRAFKENPNIKVVAVETANWKIDEAYTVMTSLYKKFPNIGAVFCANDMMALGVIKYLDESGKTQVLLAAYDALDEAKLAIKNGKQMVTIDQQADVQGYLGVKYALQKLEGQEVPLETIVDVKIIHSGNIK